ncbi:hypothetical protein P7228_11205 [Altererythrobacter arenosus]|uniref:Nucleotidyltransferase family protein n=1 Tax=Altererythrobacter arenosus TaxID=3032592 RepID=A0ABY8FT13_9SPHN|nr:hypothetical protein [Altererythrobacter sp. CAU 1644]WFL76561.1 hypothetical protein P7228_11205 [Altererythrobacter sp. CAU 1644]
MAEASLASTLDLLAREMAGAEDAWWIIGSAAVALHGGDPGTIADIDVIVSRRDLDALYDRLPLSDTPDEGKAIFRSQRFGLWSEPAMPVEFMAGLEVLREGEWLPVQPRTREGIDIGGVRVFLPERAELIAILELFGREKDRARAATLRNI